MLNIPKVFCITSSNLSYGYLSSWVLTVKLVQLVTLWYTMSTCMNLATSACLLYYTGKLAQGSRQGRIDLDESWTLHIYTALTDLSVLFLLYELSVTLWPTLMYTHYLGSASFKFLDLLYASLACLYTNQCIHIYIGDKTLT